MSYLYLYNENTHTLHIKGFCPHAKGRDLKQFVSENKALAYAGRTLGMCSLCMQKREAVLMEYVKKGELE